MQKAKEYIHAQHKTVLNHALSSGGAGEHEYAAYLEEVYKVLDTVSDDADKSPKITGDAELSDYMAAVTEKAQEKESKSVNEKTDTKTKEESQIRDAKKEPTPAERALAKQIELREKQKKEREEEIEKAKKGENMKRSRPG